MTIIVTLRVSDSIFVMLYHSCWISTKESKIHNQAHVFFFLSAPKFTFSSSQLPSFSLNSYKKIHICMINKLHFYTYTHTEGELGSCLAHSHAWPTSYNLNNYTVQDTVKQVFSHQRLPVESWGFRMWRRWNRSLHDHDWQLFCIIILQKGGRTRPNELTWNSSAVHTVSSHTDKV